MQEFKGARELQGQPALKGSRVLPAFKGVRELQELSGRPDLKVHKVRRVSREQVYRDHKVLPV